MSKRDMNGVDARSLIEHELAEFRDYVLPNKAYANLMIRVSQDYDYVVEKNLVSSTGLCLLRTRTLVGIRNALHNSP